MTWLLPHPLPSVSSAGDTHRKTGKERQLADGGLGGGAKSYDGEKAWSSINHSTHSGIVRESTKAVSPNLAGGEDRR
jgi:hypothetical protein